MGNPRVELSVILRSLDEMECEVTLQGLGLLTFVVSAKSTDCCDAPRTTRRTKMPKLRAVRTTTPTFHIPRKARAHE